PAAARASRAAARARCVEVVAVDPEGKLAAHGRGSGDRNQCQSVSAPALHCGSFAQKRNVTPSSPTVVGAARCALGERTMYTTTPVTARTAPSVRATSAVYARPKASFLVLRCWGQGVAGSQSALIFCALASASTPPTAPKARADPPSVSSAVSA